MPRVGEQKQGWGDHSVGAPLILCKSFPQESYLSQYLGRLAQDTLKHQATNMLKQTYLHTTHRPPLVYLE